jgi:hypothetical protein
MLGLAGARGYMHVVINKESVNPKRRRVHEGKDGRIAWAEKHCLAEREECVVGTIISPVSPWLAKCRWFLMRHLRRRSAHVGIDEVRS